jgi:hypothetical protein
MRDNSAAALEMEWPAGRVDGILFWGVREVEVERVCLFLYLFLEEPIVCRKWLRGCWLNVLLKSAWEPSTR